MDYRFCISPTFESAFLINGKLVEGGEIICASDGVAYITVLPLSAVLLPYTVKMVGNKVMSNPDLCKCYHLPDDRYHLKFLPRHNYVYSIPPEVCTQPTDIVDKFFISLKTGKTEDARECLSSDLSQSIDDSSLIGFFDDFADIVMAGGIVSDTAGLSNGDSKPIGGVKAGGQYYLINKDDKGILYGFVIKNGVIDNIVEM